MKPINLPSTGRVDRVSHATHYPTREMFVALTVGFGILAPLRSAVGQIPRTDSSAVRSGHILALGGHHTCGLLADSVICWGDDRFGQLGDGVVTERKRSTTVASDVRFRSLAAGYAHTCGLDEEGRAYCWGANAMGELGDGTFLDRAEPVAVGGGQRFVVLVASIESSCGLTSGGAAHCWGRGVATPREIESAAPFRTLTSTSCGVAAGGELLCWAEDRIATVVPSVPDSLTAFAQGYWNQYQDQDPYWTSGAPSELPAGVALQTCGLRPDGQAVCWLSSGEDIPLGDRDRIDSLVSPVPFRSLAVRGRAACGLTTDGAVYCWGASHRSPVREGRWSGDHDHPVLLDTDLRFRALYAGGRQMCGVTVDESAFYCWGVTPNFYGHDPSRVPGTRLAGGVEPTTDAGPFPATFASQHWGFTLTIGYPIHFSGNAACEGEFQPASEGPIDADVEIGVGFAPPNTGMERNIRGAGWQGLDADGYSIGGFRWRAWIGEQAVRIPLDGGGSALDWQQYNVGYAFGHPSGCPLVFRDPGRGFLDEIEAVLVNLRFANTPYPMPHTVRGIVPASVESNDHGLALYRAGRLPEALEEFQRAAESDFRNAEALNNVGFALYRLGRLEESVTWYRRTIAIDPERAVAYLNLGDSLEELGRHPEAVEAYERYLELDPDGAAAERVREILDRR